MRRRFRSPHRSRTAWSTSRLQELATRIAHHNTGKLCEDPPAYEVMKRIASDENRHYLFYRDLATAALERDPSAMVCAIERQVRTFEMPGTGIIDFEQHARAIARAGIYDFSVHHEQILVPVVLRHWNVEGLERPHARSRAGTRRALVQRIERIGAAGRRHGRPSRREYRSARVSPRDAALIACRGGGCWPTAPRRLACCGPRRFAGRAPSRGASVEPRRAVGPAPGAAMPIASAGGCSTSPRCRPPAAAAGRRGPGAFATSETTMPTCTGACGAARAVQVVLAVGREVEVDDARDVVDVDATCRDIGRDERRDVTVRERAQRAVALTLAAATVDRSRMHAGLLEHLHDPVDTVARAAEHDRRTVAR